MNFYGEQIEKQVLCEAFSATCEKRKTLLMSFRSMRKDLAELML